LPLSIRVASICGRSSAQTALTRRLLSGFSTKPNLVGSNVNALVIMIAERPMV
jgi:hypothetical protein